MAVACAHDASPLPPLSPERPRGRPQGRPQRFRAVADTEESLEMAAQMKSSVEQFTARQQEVLRRVKESKLQLSRVRGEVSGVHSQLSAVQAEKYIYDKEEASARAKLEKVQAEYAVLHATYTWTKSSLDSSIASQEEYRKSYNSMRESFRKAKTDLSGMEEKIEICRNAQLEREKTEALLSLKEAKTREDLDAIQAAIKSFIDRQKQKSKAVLDRLLASQGAALVSTTFQSWKKGVASGKLNAEAEKLLEEAQAHLKEFQDRKKDEAKAVLDRISSASESGLLSLVIQSWVQAMKDMRKEQEEADKLHETLRSKKIEARKTLERHLGSSNSSVLTSVFRDWNAFCKDVKKEKALKDEAQAALQALQHKKRGQSMSVVNRMVGQGATALLAQVVLGWRLLLSQTQRMRQVQAEMREREANLAAEVKSLTARIKKADEDVEDSTEMLADSREKNQLLRGELKTLLDLQDRMDANLREFDVA